MGSRAKVARGRGVLLREVLEGVREREALVLEEMIDQEPSDPEIGP